jgi:hypothetical protein
LHSWIEPKNYSWIELRCTSRIAECRAWLTVAFPPCRTKGASYIARKQKVEVELQSLTLVLAQRTVDQNAKAGAK